MNAVDVVARGLASRATQIEGLLADSSGASQIGESSGVTVQDRLDELPRSIVGRDGVAPGLSDPDHAAAATFGLQQLFRFSDVPGTSRVGQFPATEWWANKLVYDEGTSTHSAWFRGQGPRFGGVLNLAGPADYQFDIGNGSFDMFHVRLTDQAFSAANLVSDGVLRFNRGNFLCLANLAVSDFGGADGVVLRPGGAGAEPLMQEVSLSNVGITGRNGGDWAANFGSCCLNAENTGNIDTFCCNFEVARTGARVWGKNALGTFRMFGGWVERIANFALDLQDQQAFVVASASSGAIWLGDGCIGGHIELSNPGGGNGSATSSGVHDNGFGNRIGRTGALTPELSSMAKAVSVQGHSQDGFEWTRVPGYNPFALLEDDGAALAASNCTVHPIPSPLPHHPAGAGAVRLTATAAGAWVESTFAVTAGIDHLGLVGLLFNKSTASATIDLLDGSASLVSKVVSGMDADRADSLKDVFRFAKVLATHSQVTTGTLKLRVTLANSGDQAILWFLDVKPSESKHETQIANSDSSSGANAAKKYRRALASADMQLNCSSTWPNGAGMIVRGLIDVVSVGANGGYLGIGGTLNAPTQRQGTKLPDELGEREFTTFVPKERPGVVGAKLALFSFEADPSTVDLSETSTHMVYPEVRHHQVSGIIGREDGSAISKAYTTAPPPKTLWYPLNGSQFLLESAVLYLRLNAAIGLNASNYWKIDLYSKNGGGGDHVLYSWSSQAQTWAGVLALSAGRADFVAGESKLLNGFKALGVKLTRVGSPAEDFDGTAMVLAQGKLFEAAGK
jgi:hypothetical protein